MNLRQENLLQVFGVMGLMPNILLIPASILRYTIHDKHFICEIINSNVSNIRIICQKHTSHCV